MRLTLILASLLTLAAIAGAQPIVGEPLRDTIVRQQFKDQLDNMQRRNSAEHMSQDDDRNDELQNEMRGLHDDLDSLRDDGAGN